jgi:aryl-alcohol dehydrogenase-like predicted oxidoreductase
LQLNVIDRGFQPTASERSLWFVTSTIIGATTMEQLQENLSSLEVTLDRDVLAKIDAVHAQYPNPTP